MSRQHEQDLLIYLIEQAEQNIARVKEALLSGGAQADIKPAADERAESTDHIGVVEAASLLGLKPKSLYGGAANTQHLKHNRGRLVFYDRRQVLRHIEIEKDRACDGECLARANVFAIRANG